MWNNRTYIENSRDKDAYWMVSLVAQLVKNPPAMQEKQEIWVWSLGREGPLEEEMAAHSSILAWRIPWTEEPGGLVHGVAKSQAWLSNWSGTHTRGGAEKRISGRNREGLVTGTSCRWSLHPETHRGLRHRVLSSVTAQGDRETGNPHAVSRLSSSSLPPHLGAGGSGWWFSLASRGGNAEKSRLQPTQYPSTLWSSMLWNGREKPLNRAARGALTENQRTSQQTPVGMGAGRLWMAEMGLQHWIIFICLLQSCFSTSHVWMWQVDHKEGWMLKLLMLLKLGANAFEPWYWRLLESLGLQGNQTSQS